jgi:hypothetical protein
VSRPGWLAGELIAAAFWICGLGLVILTLAALFLLMIR